MLYLNPDWLIGNFVPVSTRMLIQEHVVLGEIMLARVFCVVVKGLLGFSGWLLGRYE